MKQALPLFNKYSSLVAFLGVSAYVAFAIYKVYAIIGKPSTGIDDADIFFIYARNFAGGHGIVYNIGGEHVEGFSSFLYFIICSIFYLFSDNPERYILFYNALLVIGMLGALFFSLKTVYEKFNGNNPLLFSLAVALLLGWILMNPLFIGWAVITLMDTGTYCFLITITLSFFVHIATKETAIKNEKKILAALIVLMILCRPEGMLWGLVYIASYFFTALGRTRNDFTFSLKAIIHPTTVYIITLALLVTFRLFYFGYPLPNTYYAKVSQSLSITVHEGYLYFKMFLDRYGYTMILPFTLLVVWALSLLRERRTQKTRLLLAAIILLFVGTGLIIPILEGGDHFGGFRFYQNTYPILIFPFLFLVLAETRFKLINAPLCILFAGLFLYQNKTAWNTFSENNENFQLYPKDYREYISLGFSISQGARAIGDQLKTFWGEQPPVIGSVTAGGIKYKYEGTVYDLMGLNNTKFAHAEELKSGGIKDHQSFSKKVFYELNPDIMLPNVVPVSDANGLLQIRRNYLNIQSFDNYVLKGIVFEEAFNQKYVLAVVHSAYSPFRECTGFYNREFLKQLSQRKEFSIRII